MNKINQICIIIFLIFINKSFKENKCILKALKESNETHLYFTDYLYIKTALLNYRLMPKNLLDAIRKCNIKLEKSIEICESVYGYQNCEICGMVAMEKCKPDYKRFSCGSCYKECPEETIAHSKGLLCSKPQAYKRPIYDSFEECQLKHDNCINNNSMIVPICKNNFEELGYNLCLYKCEKDFQDIGEYCMAPFYTQSDYYLREFIDEISIEDS